MARVSPPVVSKKVMGIHLGCSDLACKLVCLLPGVSTLTSVPLVTTKKKKKKKKLCLLPCRCSHVLPGGSSVSGGRKAEARAQHVAGGSASDLAQSIHVPITCTMCQGMPGLIRWRRGRRQRTSANTRSRAAAARAARRMAAPLPAALGMVDTPPSATADMQHQVQHQVQQC